MPKITNNISIAIEQLKNDCVVAVPTETVYGLAANIYSEKGLKKCFQLKKDPFQSLIVHINSIESMHTVAKNIPEIALKIANAFWPGPLTLILEKQDSVSYLITSGGEKVGVRVPNHPILLELLNKVDFPIAAPSANPFGRISPTSSAHVVKMFNDEFEFVLEGGVCQHGIESTIIGFENENPIIYRLGSLSVADIEQITGPIAVSNNTSSKVNFPGMLSKHYSPLTKIIVSSNITESIHENAGKKIGLLLYQSTIIETNIKHQEILSRNGNLTEAAYGLYNALHLLDQLNLDIIIAEKFPDRELGKVINDRLIRASK
jgi:L-threonylcarbamoyladenylate synthase